MGKRLAVVIGAAAAFAVVSTATPAAAAPTGDTAVTFAIQAGALNVTVPASANLGTGTAGAALSGSLGPVTVSDARGLLVGAWVCTVTSTNFTTGAGTAAETIPASAVSYWSGVATFNAGLGLAVPGQLLPALAAPLATTNGPIAFAKALGVGNNTTTWNPGLIVNAPNSAVAGTYTGTVTHSVA